MILALFLTCRYLPQQNIFLSFEVAPAALMICAFGLKSSSLGLKVASQACLSCETFVPAHWMHKELDFHAKYT